MIVTHAIGTTHPRWTKFNEDNALLHNVQTVKMYDEYKAYTHTEATAYLVSVNLGKPEEDMTIGTVQKVVIPTTDEDVTKGIFVSRMDAPAVVDGKAYYGVTKQGYDPTTGDKVYPEYSASTLVFDYPSLANPKMITSAVATGSTYGYRIPVSHIDEKNDLYQMASEPAKLLRIKGGDYDDSYVFDLATALGMAEVGARGWFYAGNGIGYVPFYDGAKGSSSEAAAWGIARVDIYNKSAVKLNLPDKLYLFQYQFAKVVDGKVFMAITPVGGEGNIYIFDSLNATADGFVKGASIKAGAEASFVGVF